MSRRFVSAGGVEMSLQVTQFVNGRWRQNCYIVANGNGDALIVDPGSQAEEIAGLVKQNHWQIHAILNTHGHYDHVGAVALLKDRYAAPFYLHGADGQLLKRVNLYRMLFESPEAIKVPAITHDISELPAVFEVGPFSVSWIATPGHTEGSVCLLLGGVLFSGDTLMHDAVGRTDLPGGSREQLLASVRKLMDLPRETVVCGGHGPQSTLGAEFSPGARVWSLLQ
jgi:glyoxylase-like metal-dependent hydrolase (beta-lactamase superfamily II)